jgi:hypothetical protein
MIKMIFKPSLYAAALNIELPRARGPVEKVVGGPINNPKQVPNKHKTLQNGVQSP